MIEVASLDARRLRPARVINAGLKRAIAVADVNGNLIVVVIGPGEVKFAVAVEISSYEGSGPVIHREGFGRLERAVPIAQKNAESQIAKIGYDDVDLAISVEVAESRRVSISSGGIVHRRLKRAIAVAQQNVYRAGRIRVARGYFKVGGRRYRPHRHIGCADVGFVVHVRLKRAV